MHVCVYNNGNGIHYATVVTTSFDRYHGIGLLVQGQFHEPKVDNSK